jgi:hypothetical protein
MPHSRTARKYRIHKHACSCQVKVSRRTNADGNGSFPRGLVRAHLVCWTARNEISRIRVSLSCSYPNPNIHPLPTNQYRESGREISSSIQELQSTWRYESFPLTVSHRKTTNRSARAKNDVQRPPFHFRAVPCSCLSLLIREPGLDSRSRIHKYSIHNIPNE